MEPRCFELNVCHNHDTVIPDIMQYFINANLASHFCDALL